MLTVIHILSLFVIFSKSSFGYAEQTWWETASFYQIYPRSFQDSNGDGVGDIKGVTQRLAYLKEIGITATWLSPIMTSPMADFGYDISDFYGIDPLFGTMADFEEMVVEAKKTGVKIIMDFVPNHSSDECEWFIKSVAGDPDYKDFYVWHPGKIVNGVRQPPTNWIGVFRGSMWEWNENRQAYYLHQFHKKQPDLNYRNPKVIEEMKNVIRFWLRKGIAGLRIDSVPYLFEVKPDADGNYPDAPRNYEVNDPEDHEYQLHNYTRDQPETIGVLYEFRQVVDEVQLELKSEELIIMAEAYVSLDILMTYYGNGSFEGAHIPFNTELIVSIEKSSNAYDYKRVIGTWMDNMPEGRTANWVIGNHDRKRLGTRLGLERIDMMTILIAVLPGCTITYYGEEIGMTDVWISWENTVDPQACQSNINEFERLSRDPARTPLQWNEEDNAGFTENSPWLPIAENYTLVNVKNQRTSPRSYLNIFKHLRQLRKYPTLSSGDLQVETPNENILIIKRSLEGYSTYIAVFNINNSMEFLDLQSIFPNIDNQLTYSLVTDRNSKRIGDKTSSKHIYVMPYETVVLISST